MNKANKTFLISIQIVALAIIIIDFLGIYKNRYFQIIGFSIIFFSLLFILVRKKK